MTDIPSKLRICRECRQYVQDGTVLGVCLLVTRLEDGKQVPDAEEFARRLYGGNCNRGLWQDAGLE